MRTVDGRSTARSRTAISRASARLRVRNKAPRDRVLAMGCCAAAAYSFRPRRAAAKTLGRSGHREAAGLVRGVAPEALERVELARLFLKDVEDDVAVVHQNPARRDQAFDRERGTERFGDRVGDRAGLTVGACGREDEVV